MSRRRLLVLMCLPILLSPFIGWRGASPTVIGSTPALAYSPSPTAPRLFPPPGSTVPANTEVRLDIGQDYGKLSARTDAKQPVVLSERPIGKAAFGVQPTMPLKGGTRVTFRLDARGDGGKPYGAGDLGTLIWTDAVDTKPPLLSVIGGVTRTDAIIDGGRLGGYPDHLQLTVRVEDESPVAVLVQVGKNVPNEAAWTSLHSVERGAPTWLRLGTGGPSADVRVALRALDAAGNTSAWSTTDVIPPAADEAKRLISDAGAPPPVSTEAPGKPSRFGCSF